MEKSRNKLKLFENKKIRYVWNDEEEDWEEIVEDSSSQIDSDVKEDYIDENVI